MSGHLETSIGYHVDGVEGVEGRGSRVDGRVPALAAGHSR